jgi:hypothetical protein
MTGTGRTRVFACLAVALLIGGGLAAQGTAEVFQGEAVERFLVRARLTALRGISQGVTAPQRATLELDGVTHFAVFKTIDESRPGFTQLDRGGEVSFQDSWRTEIPAYEVDKIIGLGMVPATVERELNGRRGSLQFWVQSMMPEGERMKKKMNAPDVEAWNRSMFKVRLFDNLIYNTDRNSNNILITKDFEIRLIDHSRSFRPFDTLKQPGDLTRFSRSLLEGIKRLEEKNLDARVGRLLTQDQIRGLLRRRDAILALAQRTVEQKGEAAVLYP